MSEPHVASLVKAPYHYDENVAMPKSFTKRAFLYASVIYLMIAAATVYAFSDKEESKPLDLGGATVTLALDQFGPPATNDNTATEIVEEVARETPPEPEVAEPEPEVAEPEPEREPEVKPEPPKEEPIPDPIPKEKPKPKVEKKEIKKERPKHPHKHHKKPNHDAQPNPDAKVQAQATTRRGGSPNKGQVMVFGRDNHPVLVKIKGAIDRALIYPRKAQMLRKEGTAVVQFTYTTEGRVRGLRLLKSTGDRELDEAAMKTIIRASANFPSVTQNFTLRLPITFEIR